MKISAVAKGVQLTKHLREHLDRRLSFALSRFSPQVNAVRVHLADDNGPRGGRDKTCLIVVDVRGGREVVIKERSDALDQAVNSASMRAGRSVARLLKRVQRRQRAPRKDAFIGPGRN